jgi:hypothetical protein
MPRADFLEGYGHTLLWSGYDGRGLSRALTRADLDTADGATQLRNELFGFWSSYGSLIEIAPGIPGLRRNGVLLNTSWQAGHDLVAIRTGKLRAFDARLWGDALAAAMNAAARSLGRCLVEVVNGTITIVRGG